MKSNKKLFEKSYLQKHPELGLEQERLDRAAKRLIHHGNRSPERPMRLASTKLRFVEEEERRGRAHRYKAGMDMQPFLDASDEILESDEA